MNDREIMHQALKTLLWANAEINAWMFDGRGYGPEERPEIIKAVTALQERLAHCDHCGKRLGGEGDIHTCSPKPDAYGYASRLAVAIWEQHYKDVAPQWKPLDDLMGVLTQIDNMTTGLTRLAQPEQEPVTLPHQMTPEMMKKVQMFSELGAYAAENWAGAYDTFQEFWQVAISALPAAPQRKPLTEGKVGEIYYGITHQRATIPGSWIKTFARAIEAAHGIKEQNT